MLRSGDRGSLLRRRSHSPPPARASSISRHRRRYRRSSDSLEEELLNPAEDAWRRPKTSTVPHYRIVNFERFKNWYGDGDERYAIEAYVAKTCTTSELEDDIRQEEERRSTPKATSFNKKLRESSSLLEQQHVIVEDSNMIPEGGFIQRVRIQSQYVLQYLLECVHATSNVPASYERSAAVTFIRPFRMLIFFQGKMKEVLKVLEDKWGDLEKEQSKTDPATSPINISTQQADKEPEIPPMTQSASPQNRSQVHGFSEDAADVRDPADNTYEREDIMDSIKALRDMRCYISFVDEHIMPISRVMEREKGSPTRVRFDDLWLLFKPGQNIISTSKERIVGVGEYNRRYPDAERETEKWEPYQHVWRVCSVTTPPDRLHSLHVKQAKLPIPPTSVNIQDDPDEDVYGRKSFQIRCFYLDYDGSSWKPVFTRFSIPPYDDEIDVTSLPCYPLQYCDDSEQILTELATMGKRFQNAVIDKRFYYSGITLERTPDGCPYFSRNDSLRITMDHTPDKYLPFKRSADRSGKLIESEVVVDFEETYLNSPSLRPKFIPLRKLKIHRYWNIVDDFLPIHVWDSVDRNRLLYSIKDVVQVDDSVASSEAEQWIDRTSITSWHTEAEVTVQANGPLLEEESEDDGKAIGHLKKGAVLKKDDLVLTPTRVCGYAFKEKGFFMLDLRKLQPILHQRGVFESLKIPKEYKEMVRSLVSSQFEKKKIERLLGERSEGSIDQDIIQGKGKGLVILLHGVPGVGKTATAEAVAKENQKPLFTVTYGDLGTSPSELEETLESLFHLANRWDCILLFDEADVFLAERSRTELKRNALVSVFLRVLEYYHGILFLTTNRVGSIDEAFKSRLHMMLYYPPLGRAQTGAIFKANIAKLKEIERQRQLVVDTPPLRINEDSILRFAERHYDNGLPDGGRWNGRQIKNAFQIASSMAHYKARAQDSELQSRGDGSDESKGDATVPVLDETHFMKVEKATQDFDQYITQARGFTDAKWAKMSAIRNDEFHPHPPSEHFAARHTPAPYPTHTFGGAGAHHGGYAAGPMMDSYQPGGSVQSDGNNYPYRGRNHHGGQAGYDEYDTGGASYPGGHQSQPRLHDPSRHYTSGQTGQGSMPSRSPVPSTASPHGPGLRPAPGREDFGLPGQRGGNYERYSEVPRPAVHDDEEEDAYN